MTSNNIIIPLLIIINNDTSTSNKNAINKIFENIIARDKVVNISTYELMKEESEVLNRDLGFAITPKHIPIESIIYSLEDNIHGLNDVDK